MPATGNTRRWPSGQRHLGHGRRSGSGAVAHGTPDVSALAREAVVNFLADASRATAEREAARTSPAATDAEATAATGATDVIAVAPGPEAMADDAIPASINSAALDRVEAIAAKVEADIAVAQRKYEELQAGAGAAAEAAVLAAESAMASAGTAVEAERQVRISVRQVRQNVVITVILVAIVLIVLAVATSPVH